MSHCQILVLYCGEEVGGRVYWVLQSTHRKVNGISYEVGLYCNIVLCVCYWVNWLFGQSPKLCVHVKGYRGGGGEESFFLECGNIWEAITCVL